MLLFLVRWLFDYKSVKLFSKLFRMGKKLEKEIALLYSSLFFSTLFLSEKHMQFFYKNILFELFY